jgi:hypothetical protein
VISAANPPALFQTQGIRYWLCSGPP